VTWTVASLMNIASTFKKVLDARGLHKYRLALVIALALLLKALILFGLWTAFFSAPKARHMRVPTVQVERQLLSAALPAPPTPEGK
jgi:hypothetical protein